MNDIDKSVETLAQGKTYYYRPDPELAEWMTLIGIFGLSVVVMCI